MRVLSRLVLVTLAVNLVSAFIDEEHEAVVIEAAEDTVGQARSGRQLWGMAPGMGMFGMGGMTGMYPGMQVFGQQQMFGQQQQGVQRMPSYPASTIPLSPLAQTLCRLPSGVLGFCQQYQIPGFGFPGQYPGISGQYPGVPGQFPGAPGQFPGAPGQYPGSPGQFPGAPGGFPGGQYPGGGSPVPGVPGAGSPVPGVPGGAPGGGAPGVGTTIPGVEAVVAEVEEDEEDADYVEADGPGSANTGCGLGKYALRYAANGSVAEEVERVLCNGNCERITAGFDADEHEWPWIAALMQNGRQFCGGSLIDRKHILTAAHCVAQMSRQEVAGLKVRLGEYKIKTFGETEIWESKVSRVVRHKEFSMNTLHKDVAIITLAEEVPTSLKYVSPVCLPTGHDRYTARTATVIGWGSLRENGPQPDTLQEMTVKIWDNAECKSTYGNAAPGGIMDHMLCAGKQGRDSCSGDSGGPMQMGTGNHWTQIGIVSWGIGCGKSFYPGVYTRVTEVREWIDKIVKDY